MQEPQQDSGSGPDTSRICFYTIALSMSLEAADFVSRQQQKSYAVYGPLWMANIQCDSMGFQGKGFQGRGSHRDPNWEFWNFGYLDIWISGYLDIWVSGILDICIFGYLNIWIMVTTKHVVASPLWDSVRCSPAGGFLFPEDNTFFLWARNATAPTLPPLC